MKWDGVEVGNTFTLAEKIILVVCSAAILFGFFVFFSGETCRREYKCSESQEEEVTAFAAKCAMSAWYSAAECIHKGEVIYCEEEKVCK